MIKYLLYGTLLLFSPIEGFLFLAQGAIEIHMDLEETQQETVFWTDVNGNTLSSYRVRFNGNTVMFKVGSRFRLSVYNGFENADVYLMLLMSDRPDSMNNWWLSYQEDQASLVQSGRITFTPAESCNHPQKLKQMANKETCLIFNFWVMDELFHYPLTLWAFAADPITGKLWGMDTKTLLLAPDLTKTFLSAASLSKPNIYIYPTHSMALKLSLVFPHGGKVTTSDPPYQKGWNVHVAPSGLIDGKYDYLFYESANPELCQHKDGWIIQKENLGRFFSRNMAQTGFSQKEIDDFIEHWIPLLITHPYYAIYPQYNNEVNKMVVLEVSVPPDNLMRLVYLIRGLDGDTLILNEPTIPKFKRAGFTVMEWGVILK